MPTVHFHLIRDYCTVEQRREVLRTASQRYAEVLDSPLERVRAFATCYNADECAVAGDIVDETGVHAPYFTAVVLRGRSEPQRQRLASALTDVLVQLLGVRRELVRGRIDQAAPQDWVIGGRLAAEARASELTARAQGAAEGVCDI